jgi:hypothetical protein
MNIYRISEIIRFRIINLEHMIAPTVRFQLKLASPSAWTRIIEPKLKSPIQHQSPAMPATMPLASSPMHAFTSMMMASKLDHTQDVRTTAPPNQHSLVGRPAQRFTCTGIRQHRPIIHAGHNGHTGSAANERHATIGHC